MRKNKHPLLIVLLLAILFSSCSIIGIHFKVHNPKKAKKYPEVTQKDFLFGALNSYRSCYDVHYYELNLSLFPKTELLEGGVLIKANAVETIDTFQLDLYENLIIDTIKLIDNPSPISYYRKEGAVFVTIPSKIKKGTDFSIFVEYHGSPEKAKKPPWKGGFVWKKDKYKQPWIGVACESEGASIWWPCKDHTSDEADSVVMRYNVPKDLVAVGNGKLIHEEISKDEQRKTYTWKVSYPINTYNITVYAGDFVLLEDSLLTNQGKLLLNHYVKRENYDLAKKHFQQLKPMLTYFEKTFGPFPWYNDDFKLVESPYAGMEHQSAIAYGNGYKNSGAYGFDYIILHEAAHEWWGNSVTAQDFADIWLQEGFATYSEALYVENQHGKTAYRAYMLFERWLIKNQRPLVGPRDRRFFSYKDSDAYMKGSWVLHSLRHTLEDDTLFFDILKNFAQRYEAQLVTSQHFIDLVNEKSGKDYNWFFQHYLNRREAPVLEYYLDKGENLYYRWTYVDDNFKLTSDVSYRTIEGISEVKELHPSTKVKMLNLKGMIPNSEFRFDDIRKLYGVSKNKKLKKMIKS